MRQAFKRFISKLTTTVMVAMTLVPTGMTHASSTGTLNVVVSPNTGVYEVKNDVTGETVIAQTSGSQSFGGILPGDYLVDFKALSGYETPDDQSFSITPGSTSTVTGIYTEVNNTGTINVDVSPDSGLYEIRNNTTGAVVVAETSGDASYGGIEYGDYIVDFKDISGHTTPDDVVVSLNDSNNNVNAVGTYSANNNGSVTVNVSPSAGTYEIRNNVTGVVIVAETSGSQSFSGIIFGDYIVDFKDIADHNTPDDAVFSLDSSDPNAVVNGVYTANNNGSITVNVSPSAGTYEIRNNVTGAVIVAETSGSQSFSGIIFGDYIVDFKDIGDPYITPDDVTVTLSSSNVDEIVNGTYTTTPGQGSLHVFTNIAEGLYSVRNATNQEIGNGGGTGITSFTLQEGSYSVVYTPVSGYSTPGTDFVVISEGSNITVDGQYLADPPDLTVSKQVTPTTQAAGSQVTYVITYGNDGALAQGRANNVIIMDDYDQSAMTISAGTLPPSCSDNGDVITCSVGDLVANVTGQTLTYSATINNTVTDGTLVMNSVAIDSDENDADSSNDTATAVVTVRNPDLAVTKTSDISIGARGDTITYTLDYGNNGPSGSGNATNVVLTDDYDQTLLTNVNPPAGCTDDGDIITCNIGNMGYGTTAQLVYTADISGTAANGSTITNTATMAGNEPEADLLNNTDNATVTVVNLPDLTLNKSSDVSSAARGDTITYTLDYDNNGASSDGDATNVTITDDYDETLLTNLSLPAGCSDVAGVITCNVGALNYGGTGQFVYTADVVGTAAHGSTITNTATIQANETDANAVNNTDTVNVTVDNDPDLTLTKSANVTQIDAGGTITYTLDYDNNGAASDGDATNVTIVDDYDQTLVTVAAATLPAGCLDDGDTVTCTIGSMAYGATGQVIYDVNVSAIATDGSAVINTATISATETDANAADNADSVTVNVVNVDLTIVKSVSPTSVPSGASVTYTLDYTNNGASGSGDATNVVIVDDYDQTLIAITTATLPAGCLDDGDTVTCTIGAVTYTSTGQVTYDAVITGALGQMAVNTASISATEADGNTGDNTDTATVTISNQPDLNIVKTVGANPAAANTTADYTLTYGNTGVSNATNVSIVDDYDQTQMTVVAASLPAGCLDDGDTITCTIGTVNASTTGLVINYQVDINAAVTDGSVVNNTASISGMEPDANAADNTSTLALNIANPDLTVSANHMPAAGINGVTTSLVVDYTNNGTSGSGDVSGITLTIDYDETLMTVNTPAVGCADSGTQLDCTLAGLTYGNSAQVTSTFDITGAAPNTATTNVTISSTETDDDLANNTDAATFTITAFNPPDLTISKSSLPQAGVNGTTVDYTINYGNDGTFTTGDATNVVIADDYDETNMTVVAASLPAGCTDSGTQIDCTIGTVTQSSTGSLTYQLTATGTAPVAANNTATISATETDANPLDNTATATFNITTVSPPDLTITKSGLPNAGPNGTVVTYTVDFTNNGSLGAGDATNVVIVDDYDETNMTVVAASLPAGCTDSGTQIDCTIGNLTYTSTGQLNYQMTATGTAPVTANNTATISATETDANSTDNTGAATFNITTGAVPDLTVASTPAPTSGGTGTVVTYTIDYTNNGVNGSGDATNVVITDDYDETLMTPVAATLPAGCVDSGTQIDCTIGAVVYTTTAQLTYDMTATGAAPATANNTVTISANELDGNTADNTATSTFNIVVVASPDLTIAKSASPTSGASGTVVSYTVDFTNNGASGTGDATGVVIVDDYDETLMTPVAATLPAGCTDSGTQLDCTIGGLVYTTVGQLTYDMTATGAGPATANNTATITANETDANATDNTATATFTITGPALPDLTVSKTALPTAGVTGTTIDYTVDYTNNGASGSAAATNVVVVDDYDETLLTVVAASLPAGCTDSGTQIDCTIGGLAYTATGQLTYQLTATGAAPATANNTVTISATETDANAADNTDTATFNITTTAPPDLTIAKSASPTSGPNGTVVTYTVDYTNNGASGSGDATNVVIADDYDETNMTVVAASLPAGCTDTGTQIDCTIGALTYTSTGQITYDLTATGTGPVTVNNTATISATEADGNTADNTATATFNITSATQPDLTISKSGLPNAGPNGTVVTYTIDYANNGASGTGDATGVTLVDDYDETNMTVVAATLPAGCTDSGTQIDCTIGALTYTTTGQITYDLTATGAAPVAVNNTVTITAVEGDANPADNTASATFTLTTGAVPDLTVASTPLPAAGVTGTVVTYTIDYTNNGTSGSGDATNVVITDDYDETLMTPVAATLPAGCVDSGTQIDCTIGNLTYTTVAQLTYDLTATGAAPSTANNTVTISATETDANTADNTAGSTFNITTVNPPDLQVTSTAAPTSGPNGSTVVYTIDYNNNGPAGTGDATNVVITDDYDETLMTPVAATLPAGCVDSGTQIDCTIGNLTYTTTGQVVYSMTATGAAGNTATSTVTISATETDANTADNTETEDFTITASGSFNISIVPSATFVNHNDVVTYTITLDRTDTNPGTITVNLQDAMTGTSTISAIGGGSINYILNSGSCTGVVCTGAVDNDNINQAGGLDVAMDLPGSQAIITYTARADNSGVTTNSSHTAFNTVNGTYTGQTVALNNNSFVNILGDTTGAGGTFGAGGGSLTPIFGDLELDVQQEVSLDGQNFVSALSEDTALQVPEHLESKIYHKVTINNKGGMSALNVKFQHFYEENGSGLDLVGITDVENATYNAKKGQILVEKVKAGKSHSFTYVVNISDRLASPAYAEEWLELISYKTGLPKSQDHLSKVSIGDIIKSYFFAGPILVQEQTTLTPTIPTASQGSSVYEGPLSIAVNGPDWAFPGEVVNYLITVTNNTGEDFTGMQVTFDYAEQAMFISQAIGANDNGREVSFQRAILRPGEALTFPVEAQVSNTAPTGETMRNLVRLLVNEKDGIPTVSSMLDIVPAPLTEDSEVLELQPDRPFELAKTGTGSLMLYLIMITMIGYMVRVSDKLRYIRMRKLALNQL